MIQGLGEKLKALRLQNGYSQKYIADKLSLSPSLISSYEASERTPSLEVLQKLVELYHCSADYLLAIKSKPISNTLDVSGLTPQEVQAVRTIVEVIQKQREQV